MNSATAIRTTQPIAILASIDKASMSDPANIMNISKSFIFTGVSYV